MSTVSRRSTSTPRQLARVGDRLSFTYLERCTVHRDDNAITATDTDGTTPIPASTIGTLLLGPGTRITHQAMSVLSECGASVAWDGEHGVRLYAGGRALTRSSTLAEAHASAWANQHTRLEVARAMYRLRFPNEDPAGRTRQDLLSSGPRARGGVPNSLTSSAQRRTSSPQARGCSARPHRRGPLLPVLPAGAGVLRRATWRLRPQTGPPTGEGVLRTRNRPK